MADPRVSYEASLLDPSVFSVSWELVPSRGAFARAQREIVSSAEVAAKSGKIHAVTIVDNAGGNPATSAEMLSAEICRLGIEPLVHLTCKDKNRNELEALLYGLQRAGVRTILALTGDYPGVGYGGRAYPVFDLDATQLLGLIGELSKGSRRPTPTCAGPLAEPGFFPGAAVSPFKALESEQMGQYFKLKKKLAAGARFIVTQLGYDARKFHEALLVMKEIGYQQVPLVGNIYVLSLDAARHMNRGRVPGGVVTEQLVGQLEREAEEADGGRSQQLERGAKMYALLRGMGYAGAHIGGRHLSCSDVEFIIDRGEELAANWRNSIGELSYSQPGAWYTFERDAETGLNTARPAAPTARRRGQPWSYAIFRMLHKIAFSPGGRSFAALRSLAAAIDGSSMQGPFTRLEQVVKSITNDCLHCGDCALIDAGYLCVTSQCPKGQRNGPCGGSSEGWCEVYPEEQECIYVRAYDRLKTHGAEQELAAYQVPPVDHSLRWTSSWLNYYLGRDHTAQRFGIPKVDAEREAR